MSMSPAELNEAAKLARHFLRGFESFAQLAKAFDEAGSAVAACDAARAEHTTLLGKVQDARDAHAAEVERQATAVAEAESKVSAAQGRAESVLADAHREAKSIKAKAAEAADAATARARVKVEAMEQTESEAGERVATLRSEATQLEARVAAAKAEIAKLLGQA
jgi:chromosome segregation ATPase